MSDHDEVHETILENEKEWRRFMMKEIKELRKEVKGLRVITGVISSIVSGGITLVGYFKK